LEEYETLEIDARRERHPADGLAPGRRPASLAGLGTVPTEPVALLQDGDRREPVLLRGLLRYRVPMLERVHDEEDLTIRAVTNSEDEMKFSAKVLLLVGNAALGVVLLTAPPRDAVGQPSPKTGCCKHDMAGNGVCCIDCCTTNNGCTSSSACPKKPRT